MIVLGLNCGFSRPEDEFIPNLPHWFGHDAAAVLMVDGEVMAAVEEERLNRLKHTNKFPTQAVTECLAQGNLRLSQVDRVAYCFKEEDNDKELGILYGQSTNTPIVYSRELIAARLAEAAEEPFDSNRIRFVNHHTTHAHATYYHSGFLESLVAVIDGSGERESTSLCSARGGRIEMLKTFPISKSLGHLYSASIELLGYTSFDEYKVMGLAPHGDAARYRRLFTECYQLVGDGDYELDFTAVRSLFFAPWISTPAARRALYYGTPRFCGRIASYAGRDCAPYPPFGTADLAAIALVLGRRRGIELQHERQDFAGGVV